MLDKTVEILIRGNNFYPSKISKSCKIKFSNFHDVGDLVYKTKRTWSFGSARIKPPYEIHFNEQEDDSDDRITWLLDQTEQNLEFIKLTGGTEIILDIEYSLDLENRAQSYIDNLTIDQIDKMSKLGIVLNITIWPN